ncbi:MAG: hypothetical protein P4M11_04425 [Candidatus Pacebacteria bacterium]|nr:hypothetical protein [Candidatus Paceibacterota bacterium]
MKIELCDASAGNYLLKSDAYLGVALIMIALYVLAEAYCIFSSIRTIQKVNLRDDIVLIPMMITLNVTLVFRVLYYFGGIKPFCYPNYWYYYFGDIANLSKDLCLLCLIVRVWDYLSSFETVNDPYPTNITYTYYFMGIHFFAAYVFILIEDSQASDDLLFHYLGGVQIILLFVFSYGFYKLFTTIRTNPDAKVEREVLVLNATSVLVIITIFARIVYNLIFQNLENGEESDGREALIVTFSFNATSELFPCILITLILFFQQQNLKDSVLAGSGFGLKKASE